MVPLPGKPQSLWLDRERREPWAALGEDVTADVAVVGGGIVGAAAALFLAERGASVVLVEARSVAAAVTGHSTAKVTALHERPYSRIAAQVSAEAARAYAQLNLAGVGLAAQLIERHDIECGLERAPNHLYTETDDAVNQIEEEAEAAVAAGLPVELTDQTDLPFAIRIAARLDNQLQLDSAALTVGIAEAAAAAGARIHEGSRVRSISHGDPCRLELENGSTLRAERVLLATQMPMLDRGLYFARLRPQASYAVAAPAADAPLGMYLGIGDPVRSIRSHAGAGGKRHVIVGGEGHKVGQADGAERYRRLAGWLAERFDAEPVTHRWSAHDLMSPDALPMIGELAPPWPRISVATGFSKWGLAAGMGAAELLAGSLEGEPDERMKPFAPARLNARPALTTLVMENANVGIQFTAGRLRRSKPGPLEAGEGTVVGDGIDQVAECRDYEGNLHRLSARCTHLGCIVRWNSGDATWDCPCHGSRFAADGAVLNGPATAPLEPVV